MNNDQVKELLKRSKVYIDFGNHPGKDRLPREAALMNCCIVCAKRGSAKNEVDMPIDEIYKININENDWWINAKKIIDDCMCNYETHINHFDRYRLMVKNEKNMFNESVKKLVIYCNDRGDNNE